MVDEKQITESSVQKSITEYLSLLQDMERLFYFRLNSGKVRVGRRWIKLAPKNSPDFLVLIPFKMKEHGMPMLKLVAVAFEIKRPYKARWTEGQIRFAIDFETRGGKYYKVDSFEMFKELVDDWLKRGKENV